MPSSDRAFEGSVTPRSSTPGPRPTDGTKINRATRAASLKPDPPLNEKMTGKQQGKTQPQLPKPKNNMFLVFTGLMLAMFLAALDQTIAAIALPTIVSDIGGQDAYSWVGSAYLLTSACLIPVYGVASDIYGSKPILYGSIAIFLVGSGLCGAAQNFAWLAACRGLQGIGGGGVETMVIIVMTEITSYEERGFYGALISATWGIASVVGPLIGGLLTQHASWRWCFFINLPTGGIAALILVFFLKLNPVRKTPLRLVARRFDFVGLSLLSVSIVLLLLGFQFAQSKGSGWTAPQTIIALVVGVALFVLGIVNELDTRRDPIIPPMLLKMRTTVVTLISCFIHTFTLFAATYYVPLYFQILGSSATLAGVKQLPISLGASLVSIVVGLVFAPKSYLYVTWGAWALMTLGYGLMIMFDTHTKLWLQEVILIITGIGIGSLFQPPMIILQKALENVQHTQSATGTATFMFIRTLGGAIGISVGDTIFLTRLDHKLASISGYNTSSNSLTEDYTALSQIQPDSLRDQVLSAYTSSLSTIWIVFVPITLIGLICALLAKNPFKEVDNDPASAPDQPGSSDKEGIKPVKRSDTVASILMNAEAARQSARSAEFELERWVTARECADNV